MAVGIANSLIMQRFLCYLYSLVYRRWLWNDYFQDYDKVIRVNSWRTAIVDVHGCHRQTITPLFWWLDEDRYRP